MKHGSEDERDRDHRPADFFHGFERSLARRQPMLDVVLDGFDHDNRVIDH